MARQIRVDIIGDASSLERAFGKAKRDAVGFNASITGLGRSAAKVGAGLGLAFGGQEIVRQLNLTVQAASSLNEEVSKSEVIFGASARDVRRWADTTADAFGISNRAALQAASGFGQMLETSGATERDAARMSRALVELGGDLASFNNISTDEALEKLRSGLAGEAEPLRVLGVQLSEARVQQVAWATGIAQTGSKLTEQQKVLGRYAIIMQDTAKAQGDAARTGDQLAGSQRRLAARTEELRAKVGQDLIPIYGKLVDALLDAEEKGSALYDVLHKIASIRVPEELGGGAGRRGFQLPFGGERVLGLVGKELKTSWRLTPVGQAWTGLELLERWTKDEPTVRVNIDWRQKGSPFSSLTTLIPGGGGKKAAVNAFGQPGFKPGGAPPVPLGPTIEQQNAWWDAMIGRREDRVQDISNLRGQLAALQTIAGLITRKLAVTKDITRRLTLQDELNRNLREQRGIREQMAQDAADALQAAQFQALGLTASGAAPTQSRNVLQRRFGTLSAAVKGTSLDTKAWRDQMAKIRSVLNSSWKTLTVETRGWIQDFFDETRRALDQGQTSVRKVRLRQMSSAEFVRGLGLSPDQARAVAARYAGLSPGGGVPAGRSLAFAGGGVVITGPVSVYGVQDLDQLEEKLQKRTKARRHNRRGVVSP